jgi:hypothetical protein
MAMTPKNLQFLRLYLGRNSKYFGNATRCYAKVYECTNERVSQTSGSRLLRRPEIAKAVQQYRDRAAEATQVDANFVLEQSVHLYDVSMGNTAVEVDAGVDKLGHPITIERRDLNLTVASKALELIGRHTTVQAFQDNVEHNHTHRLEKALQAKAKQVEAAAANRTTIEGNYTEVSNDLPAPATPEEEKKRVHQEGGHRGASISARETSSERAGASGN